MLKKRASMTRVSKTELSVHILIIHMLILCTKKFGDFVCALSN